MKPSKLFDFEESNLQIIFEGRKFQNPSKIFRAELPKGGILQKPSELKEQKVKILQKPSELKVEMIKILQKPSLLKVQKVKSFKILHS